MTIFDGGFNLHGICWRHEKKEQITHACGCGIHGKLNFSDIEMLILRTSFNFGKGKQVVNSPKEEKSLGHEWSVRKRDKQLAGIIRYRLMEGDEN
ncbi:hypothetical protein H5410_002210 [Solanum commersonii]|uniref:Uncharacterized protein n=1 Tax=Solanum commersonii TaxID=4109 RepID=A0A9J6B126_SOLCO|nr:hypothetical protein H5410_002210 [Solanum commersonii]